MPIYEYQCTECEHKLESLQKISAAPLTDCPACNEPALKKLVSAASFRLKGAGWYETDFKTGEKKQLADSDSGGDVADSGSEDKGSEDKGSEDKGSEDKGSEDKGSVLDSAVDNSSKPTSSSKSKNTETKNDTKTTSKASAGISSKSSAD
jgi:putative FmdB family regulatory protein